MHLTTSSVIEGSMPRDPSWIMINIRGPRLLFDHGKVLIRVWLNEGWIGVTEMRSGWVDMRAVMVQLMMEVHRMLLRLLMRLRLLVKRYAGSI